VKRVWVAAMPAPGAEFAPDAEESHHLLKVRRAKVGERVELLDGRGGLMTAELIAAERGRARLRALEPLAATRESPLRLTVALGLPQQLAAIDDLLPGLAQIGVNAVILTEVQHGGGLKKPPAKLLARLEAIARNALKQCGRTVLPELRLWTDDWPNLCADLTANHDCALLCHPVERSDAAPEKAESAALLIGPEGGFSPAEVEAARAAGVLLQSMGPRILKMETAALCAAWSAQSRWGDAAL